METLEEPKRIALVSTNDPYTKLKAGDKGYETGNYVDPWGVYTTMCKWDNGSTLSLIRGQDSFRYVSVDSNWLRNTDIDESEIVCAKCGVKADDDFIILIEDVDTVHETHIFLCGDHR
jgi:hypothetical protein